ncbi:hypothetical protein ABZ193_43565, partial [Amycolatopsis sp. NPDC006125]
MSSSSPASQFGPNEWLVEEMYDQFLADPNSVDAAWHEFFSDFKPTQTTESKPDAAPAPVREQPAKPGNGQVNQAATAPAAPAQPKPAAKPAAQPAKP